jgi:FtsP/CotA-like multicopper oxidase with cupredoxin domain
MHVSPSGIADNVFRTLEPGETMKIEIDIPIDHPLGLFHYHPHHHGSVFLQMGGGMVGAISVQDNVEETFDILILQAFSFNGGLLTNLDLAATACHSRLAQHAQVSTKHAQRAQHLAALFPTYQPIQDFFSGPTNTTTNQSTTTTTTFPTFYTINGQYVPEIPLVAGKPTFFRVLHAGPTDLLALSVPGCTLDVIAKDSYPTAARSSSPDDSPPLLLPPGSRADVVLTCPIAGTTNTDIRLVSLLTRYKKQGPLIGRAR